MSDKLENFIRNHREQFDAQVPSNQVWTNIQTGITQQAASAAGSSAASTAAAGKAGLAKVALGWKIALVATFSAIVGTGIYLATTASDEKDGQQPEKMAAVPPQNANDHPSKTAKLEYLYQGSAMVVPPMPSANVPYQAFTVNADKGGQLTAASGTTLKVAPGTFVDAQGNPVSGDVQIQYREFHDAEDIILSGITMQYNENGAKENFQTAGMMEILGSQGEAPVFIAPGKSIDVRMASFTPEDDYNLYFLDPKTGWKDIGVPATEKNKDKKASRKGAPSELAALEAAAPRPPVKGEKGVEQDGEVMFNVDYNEFPELKPFKEVRWMAEDKAEYKALEEKIMSHVWNEVDLEELDSSGLRYKITLTRKAKATLSINVKPILEGKDYEKGMERFKKKKASYDKILKEKEIEMERLATQADVFRTFTISGFGIYNCDRFYGAKDVVSLNVKYEFPEDSYINPDNTIIYHITGNNRAVMNLDPNVPTLKFVPADQNFLVVVLPNNKVAVFGPDDFAKLAKGPRIGKSKVGLVAKDMQVHTASDLRLLLGV